ncbi:MAG TPA: tRNA uridine-5-carboxymethylaminomethyl(34) synthesis GTPase MnmE [Burkholderiales bacterium]|nr:tRNA uridine-5-carboxymethylaminomethyl(34) synthesis GTPase MnmE [Burkholderiales bacterium]
MTENLPIAAIATAPGLSAIGVVRVSGPRLGALIAGLIGAPLPPRHAVLAPFRDADGDIIDQGIALYFPAPQSYTGEEVLELQGHGGPVVLQQLLQRCLQLGARLAEPGEFTQRAYLNDKLDLAQAESVADLISAATVQAARGAMRSLQGAFSQQIDELVRSLVELRALVEATLDFPDEEIDFLAQADCGGRLAALGGKLAGVLSASRQGSLLREGVHIVLAGQPNVGKSSLLNRLSGAEVAIVTEIPGTTRDAIRQTLNLEGIPAHIIDTAGLRESRDTVERLGIERTWAAIDQADLVLLVVDATLGVREEDLTIIKKLPSALPCITVMNKTDLLREFSQPAPPNGPNKVWISARTGAGIEALRAAILQGVGWNSGGEGLFIARERHIEALLTAQRHLHGAVENSSTLELCAEELRLAQEALGTITGEYTSDDLLGEIFSRFCIGK